MIPDKVYIDNKTITRIEGFIPKDYPATEYICKDAIIEWARNSLLDEYSETNQFAMGYRQSMRDLINKLNSM